jgi:hypothetical protein
MQVKERTVDGSASAVHRCVVGVHGCVVGGPEQGRLV